MDSPNIPTVNSPYVDDINNRIQRLSKANPPQPIGQISDGFHTFDELYDHRCTLFAQLLNSLDKLREYGDNGLYIWKCATSPGDAGHFDGFFLAGMCEPDGSNQITYHLPYGEYWDRVLVEPIDSGERPAFDGHTPNDVITRLRLL